MKKSHIFYILGIVFVLSFSIIYVTGQMNIGNPEGRLHDAFNISGAKAVSAEMYFKGRIAGEENTSIEDLKELADRFSRDLKIQGESRIYDNLIENDLIGEIKLDGIMEDGRSAALRIRIEKLSSGRENKYISLTVTEDGSRFNLEKTRKEGLGVFSKNNIEAEVTSCITGAFEGKLKKDEMNEICKAVFREANATKVEGIKDGNLISVSAYSPSMGSYIAADDNRINLNIALRYNSYEDKTYIWLAAPVIMTEY